MVGFGEVEVLPEMVVLVVVVGVGGVAGGGGVGGGGGQWWWSWSHCVMQEGTWRQQHPEEPIALGGMRSRSSSSGTSSKR